MTLGHALTDMVVTSTGCSHRNKAYIRVYSLGLQEHAYFTIRYTGMLRRIALFVHNPVRLASVVGRHVGWPVSVGGFALISAFMNTYPSVVHLHDIGSVFNLHIKADCVSVFPVFTWACSDSFSFSLL